MFGLLHSYVTYLDCTALVSGHGRAPADFFEDMIFSEVAWFARLSVGHHDITIASAYGSDYNSRGLLNSALHALHSLDLYAGGRDDSYNYDSVHIDIKLTDLPVHYSYGAGLGGHIDIDLGLAFGDSIAMHPGHDALVHFEYNSYPNGLTSWYTYPTWDVGFSMDVNDVSIGSALNCMSMLLNELSFVHNTSGF